MKLQDDEYLYLVMEYLAGGDVMVRATVPLSVLMHPLLHCKAQHQSTLPCIR